jgi:hypothetical protein
MGILLGIMAQWRYALAGLLVAGAIILGWTVATWKIDAQKAQAYRDLYRAELARRVEAVAKLNAAQVRLRTRATQVVVQTKEIVRRVKVYIRDDRDCDLNADVVELLNNARAGMFIPPRAPGPGGPGGPVEKPEGSPAPGGTGEPPPPGSGEPGTPTS